MTTNIDKNLTISDYLTTLGLTMDATFTPTPQPKELVKNPQLHWMVTLKRGNSSFSTPYHQGCAHVKGYKQSHKTPYDRRMHEEMIRKTCETGKLYNHYSDTFGWMARSIGEKTQPPPSLLDVLYCLLSDSDVLNYPTFESWAENFGYETDSRKAETIYRQCLETALQLKNMMGCQAMEELQRLYQDY